MSTERLVLRNRDDGRVGDGAAEDPINKLDRLIGPAPAKVALDCVSLEREECGSFTREKIEYSVERGDRVRAYVLVPKAAAGPLPAIYCHHQHAGNFALGKSEVVGLAGDPDQAYARELAERGFVAFAPDAVAFEERNWSAGTDRAQRFELLSRLVQGRTLLAKILHDASVGVDCLCSRPEVDPSRIGFIGHSYGGRMALWVPAQDERITASVSHCGCIPYRYSMDRASGVQAEFCVPGIAGELDVDDVVRMVAPRSLLISATTRDVWSRGAKEIYEATRESFPPGALSLELYDDEHRFTPRMRERAYVFLERALSRVEAAR